VVGVRLTAKAEQIHDQARESYFATLKEMVDYLGEADCNQLVDLLDKVNRFYDEKASQEADSPWWKEERGKVD
jgi:hypothetical protein